MSVKRRRAASIAGVIGRLLRCRDGRCDAGSFFAVIPASICSREKTRARMAHGFLKRLTSNIRSL
jgi:hypothetical protein